MTRKISIGSDPEFGITDKDGILVPANKIFGGCGECNPCDGCNRTKCTIDYSGCGACDGCEYTPGSNHCNYCDPCCECDSCREEVGDCDFCADCRDNMDLECAEIGCDGNNDIGELRPRYSKTPNDHHDNIKDLIGAIDIPSKYEIRAGTNVDGRSIGGHIHIGGYEKEKYNETFFKDLSNYMSRYVGMPLRMIEHPEDLEKRGYPDYGFGQFGQHHCTNYGIEWRMPASWLVSSDIALSALCLARIVAGEYDINPQKIIIPKIIVQRKTIESKFVAPRMIGKIEKMQDYSKYSKELQPLFELLIEGKKWKTDIDIRNTW